MISSGEWKPIYIYNKDKNISLLIENNQWWNVANYNLLACVQFWGTFFHYV